MNAETSKKLGPFREEALRQGIPSDDVERWTGIARQCATLGPDGDGPVVAQVGGHPMLPADAPDYEFPFVASIDCAALPREATDLPLPPDGHLLLFVEYEEPEGEVVYVPAGTAVSERRPTEENDWFPVYSQSRLRLSVDPSLPNHGSAIRPEHPHGEALGGVWWKTCTDIQSNGPLQIGGYPWSWNNDPVQDAEMWAATEDTAPQSPKDQDWVLLAEWSADVEELDQGLIHWVIRRDDLAALRFDRVHVCMDMMG
ncbi:DUF1963 domain-containing protein [Streptomyces sp. 2A115]|uniref:DUF1963 domain-containing protein n=1 Tax=Streptomyces sp. 2A115 TaxID=3457439 RepID=UPI003FD54229